MTPEASSAGAGTSPSGLAEPDEEVRWGLGDAIAGLAVTLLAPVVVIIAVLAVAGRQDLEDIPLWATALLQVPLWAGLLGAPVLASWTKGRASLAADFGLKMRWTDIPLGLVVGFVGQFALLIVLGLVYQLLGIDTDRVGETAEALTGRAKDAVGVALLILVVAIGAPLLEELFYRGLWLRALARRWGTAWAVILSSLLFGLVHLQLYDFPALAGFGAITAVLTVRSGRLGPAIWAHVAFNVTAVVSLLAQ